MKKRVLIAIVLAITVGLLGSAAMAAVELDAWQIGTSHGGIDPIDGAAEYPASEAYTDEFDYYVGTDLNPINSPSMPGYIGPANVCEFAGGRPCTDTTANLNIHFGLACNYDDGELTLVYDRYGSESDNLYLDGIWFATISATEGGFRQFSFPLEAASSGNHTITIEYAGGGSGNGHYIDYLKLVSTAASCGVSIDIKPGSWPNSISSCRDTGVLPVAILGSDTFDVSDVEPLSVLLMGAGVRIKGKSNNAGHYEDVDEDGYTDLVLQLDVSSIDWTQIGEEGRATITGQLQDGTPIEGYDYIRLFNDGCL